MLVDCIRISEFDYDFVCAFACLVAKKMQEKRWKSWTYNFLGKHVLGGEHEEQILFK